MWTPVGKASFVDCAMLTWLFGLMTSYLPFGWPRSSRARLAITSLAFMLMEVPGAALDRVDDELGVELSGDDVVGGRARWRRRCFGVEVAGVAVGERRGLLHDAHGADERRVDAVGR